jgi:flagellum-specific ATP synthase
MVVDQPAAWKHYLDRASARVQVGSSLEVRGTLTRLAGLVLETSGLRVPVGSQCLVSQPDQTPILAEVVGFSQDRAFLMPAGDVHGLSSGAGVVPAAAYVPVPLLANIPTDDTDLGAGLLRLPLGTGLLGRVVDAHGHPIDRMGPISHVSAVPLDRRPINPMDRAPIREPLDTGVRAINAC